MAKHKGGCHCGKIAYQFEGDVAGGLTCNCSLCAMRGGILTFVPESAFVLETPRENLSVYHFNKGVIDHYFCPVCGAAPFSEGSDGKGNRMVAINLRCVEGVDPDALAITHHDGRGA